MRRRAAAALASLAAPPLRRPATVGAVRQLNLAGATRETVAVGDQVLSLESGRLARLADAAVTATQGGSSILVTLVAQQGNGDPTSSFLPLSVDFRERWGAAGRIPGTFTRREGPPKERETLTGRVVDRAVRPLFAPGFGPETQVMATVLAADGGSDLDVLALNAASAVLAASDLPWAGPVGCVRLAILDGHTVLHPSPEQAAAAELVLLYAGSEARCLMIEAAGSGDGVSNAVFAQALRDAHAAASALIPAQRRLAERLGHGPGGTPKRACAPPLASPELCAAVAALGRAPLRAAWAAAEGKGKAAINAAMESVRVLIRVPGAIQVPGAEAPSREQLDAAFTELAYAEMRSMALSEGRRVDGRSLTDLRRLRCEAGVLPHVHGSSLFERGDTQCLATATLGPLDDSQRYDSLTAGSQLKRMMLHYAFPPFAVNETGRPSSLGRREVGHGALAEKALAGSMPSVEAFPYAVRINVETLMSNGSSSMAAVCCGSMALMQAGVPLTRHVAGVSVGLVMEEASDPAAHDPTVPQPMAAWPVSPPVTRYAILSDIQGLEDFLGDMDFKIAGTATGITGVQLDVKPAGVPVDILVAALEPALAARRTVLELMTAAIPAPNAQSDASPRAGVLAVERESIGRLIGPGGSNIKDIERRTGAKVSVDGDAATVSVFASSRAAFDAALGLVEASTAGGAKVGDTVTAKVVQVRDFGAILQLPSGEQGLLHISEVTHERLAKMEGVFQLEEQVTVQVVAKDPKGALRLSRKALLNPPPLLAPPARDRAPFDRSRLGRQ